jgi:Na+/phosphate symporter
MHIPNVLDACVVLGTTVAAAASSIVLSDPAVQSPEQIAEMRLFLLPFIGSLITSGGLIMLNPNPEERRIVVGRCIFALFVGVLVPQVIGMIHPSLAALSVKPVFLVLGGGLAAALAYVLSKPFTRELYQRADGIAKRGADQLQDRYAPGSKGGDEA